MVGLWCVSLSCVCLGVFVVTRLGTWLGGTFEINHIKGVTIGIIIVGTTIITIIIGIHNVGCMCSSISSRNWTVVCVYWYRGGYSYVGGNKFGIHGLQLFVFLLLSWAIVWMYCRIDNVSIIGIIGIG